MHRERRHLSAISIFWGVCSTQPHYSVKTCMLTGPNWSGATQNSQSTSHLLVAVCVVDVTMPNPVSGSFIRDGDGDEFGRCKQKCYEKRTVVGRCGKTFLMVSLLIFAAVCGVYLGLNWCQDTFDPAVRRLGGAVVTNGVECAKIGRDIFLRNGSAADAAIASLLCEAVACPQNMGLGGGFMATIYIKSTGKAVALNAREVAPLAAYPELFANESTVSGVRAIAVPAALKGYWELHRRYGSMPWSDLFQPTIAMCRKGSLVTAYFGEVLKQYESAIKASPTMSDVFMNPATGRVWKQGDRIRRPQLAEALTVIAREGANSLYSKNGTILRRVMDELRDSGSLLTEEDFLRYRVRWLEPETAVIRGGNRLFTSPLPGTGFLVSFVLKVLDGFRLDESALSYHRIVEALKFAFARRTEMADPQFVDGVQELVEKITNKEYVAGIYSSIASSDRTYPDYEHYGASYDQMVDHGTAHINVLAPNGDAISISSSINRFFGSMIRSRSTDIIFNDLMDDFSTPGISNHGNLNPSPLNFIQHGKQPLSSLSPTVIVDQDGDVRLVIGAAGGPKITSSVVLGIIRHLYMNHTLDRVIAERRIHHQLMPMEVIYETGFDALTLAELQRRGHRLHEVKDFGSMTLIGRRIVDGLVSAHSDPRRPGSVEVF